MTSPPLPPDDGLPPGQPYVSPDDLAAIGPLWEAEVAQMLPMAAQIYAQSAGQIHSGIVDVSHLPDLPGASPAAATAYMAALKQQYTQVGDRLWQNARTELTEGFKQGESIPQLAARLRGAAGMTERRAVLVARSAVIESSNAGSIATARAVGLQMDKQWIATHDARTRPTHRFADGQRVALNESFMVGGFSADAPGDPALPPDERKLCRCTLGYVMGGDDVADAQHQAYLERQQAALPGTTALGEDEAAGAQARAEFEAQQPAVITPAAKSAKQRSERAKGYPERYPVTDAEAPWRVPYAGYDPPSYTAPSVLKADRTLAPPGGDPIHFWADPQDVRDVRRQFHSYEGAVHLDEFGRPMNPYGRTGIQDRGLLGKWGANTAADPIVTRINPVTGRLEMAAIKRGDSGQWAIPGGMVDEGESVSATLAREFAEETGAELDMTTGRQVYRGFVDDPRNTDNAWMETNAVHRHLTPAEAAKVTFGEAGQQGIAVGEIQGIGWREVDAEFLDSLYASHGDFVRTALQQMVDHPTDLSPAVREQIASVLRPAAKVPELPSPVLGLPKRAPTGVGTVTVPDAGVRPILAVARTPEQVSRAFEGEAARITGRTGPDAIVADFQGSVPTAQEHAEGILRGLEAFPEADLRRVLPDALQHPAWGPRVFDVEAYAEAGDGGIAFNPAFTSDAARAGYLRDVAKDEGNRWHPSGSGSPIFSAIHEFGHVVDIETLGEVSAAEIKAIVRASAQAAKTTESKLIKAEVSRYADSSTAELIAESFADVLINGQAASKLSRDIFDVLVRNYEAGGRALGPSGTISQIVREGLAGMRVTELRALAKERGVPGYAKMTKPQLVERLRATPEPIAPKVLATADDALRAARVDLTTAAERKAYADYVSQYRSLNTALRENGGLIPEGRAFAADRRLASGLDSAMARAGLPQDIQVYRLTGTAEFPGGVPAVGAEWTDGGFVSTSTRQKLDIRPGEVSMRIRVPAGSRAVAAPELDVNEVLLNRGSRFRVVSAAQDERGIWQVEAEVIPPPVVAPPVTDAFAGMKVGELRALAKERGIAAANLTKPQLLERLRAAETPSAVETRLIDHIKIPFSRVENGDIVVLTSPDGTTTFGRIAEGAHRRKFVDWEGGSRERLDEVRRTEKIALYRATVAPKVLSEAEQKAAVRAAARERNRVIEAKASIEKTLAHIDELLAKKAGRDLFEQALRESAGLEPKDVAALRAVIGDPVRLRAATTRIAKREGIAPGTKAGAKVKYDPELHEPLGVAPAEGTQVEVIRRGSSVVIDGDTVQLERALVRAVPTKPVRPPKIRPPAQPVPIRDLIDAPDAEIEAALRDVYEGKFGPFTTKIEVNITRAGTRTAKTGRTIQIEPSIGVSGKIYDSAGHEIGDFGRSISPVEMHYSGGLVRRETWADHSIVQMDAKYQGKGFGGEFNRRAIEWYRESDVHGISLSDHNGYVWASQGFNFNGGIVPEHTVTDLRELIADLRAGRRKDRFGAVIPKALREAPNLDAQIGQAEALLARLATTKPGTVGYPTAYEMSQLGRAVGQKGKTAIWLGKHLPVHTGELILNPTEGVVIST